MSWWLASACLSVSEGWSLPSAPHRPQQPAIGLAEWFAAIADAFYGIPALVLLVSRWLN